MKTLALLVFLLPLTAWTADRNPPMRCYLYDASGNAISSTAGALNIAGGIGGGGGNAAAGLTGVAVPASSDYTGFNSGGNLVGVSSANPLPVACTKSGTWAIDSVGGTVAISAASLPLPTGAATSIKQPALGTAGSASADVLSVQGVASMTPLKVDGSGVTQPVSGTFWPSTQPVSGTFWQTTQPVSIASMPSTPVTGTFWQATQPVSGTFWQATQPVSLASLPALANQAAASNNPIGAVSLGNSLGKTNVGKPGSLATSAATADQVIVTYTVTAGKTFYLSWFACNSRLTTFAATATNFGTCSLESPAGTKLLTTMIAGPGIGDRDYLPLPEPIPIAAGVVVRVVTTPAATTAMTWQGNIGGYEK